MSTRRTIVGVVAGCALCGLCVGGTFVSVPVPFIRGDFNGDNTITVADPVVMLMYLFANMEDERAICLDAGDSNDDGRVDLGDAVHLLTHLFAQGPPPPAPYPLAGEDPTEDDLRCEAVIPITDYPGYQG